MNLLTNALKYGAGEPITITISSDGCIARCLIHDQGIGISQDSQERIFSCFERAVSYKNFGGLGLGLYISRQIIVTHGGTMRVESELGKGATFIFELPVA
jgi:signal transduction histidine kinase